MTDFVPAGDPEAMRATARALVAQADGVRLAPEGAAAGFDALVLEGPAAARLRLASMEVRQQAQQAAAGLEAVASALQADAARVEQMNEERRLCAVQSAAAATREAAAQATQEAAQAARAAQQAAADAAQQAPANTPASDVPPAPAADPAPPPAAAPGAPPSAPADARQQP